MTVKENIHYYTQLLPKSLQVEVLNFIKYLLFKKEQETVEQQNDSEWTNLSLTTAMRGMEDEKTPLYTTQDLKVTF